ANWFAPEGTKADTEYSFERQNWHAAVAEEHKAVREGVAVFDQTSFAKLLVQGRDACTELNRICAANVDVPIGKTVYTGLLNKRGGFESDLTVIRTKVDAFFIITGSAQAVRDADWISRNFAPDAHVFMTDVTSAWSVLALMGPKSRDVLGALTKSDLSNDSFPFGTCNSIDLGYAAVMANRMTYVGELGWELIVPTEFSAGVYDDLMQVGADHGIRDAGYYALDGLRIEKGYRAWSRELTPDITPLQAGLGFAVDFDKPGGFIGKDALLAAKADPNHLSRRIIQLVLSDAEAQIWGGEAVLCDGVEVGEVRSAGYGHTLGAAVALCDVEVGRKIDQAFIDSHSFVIDLAGQHIKTTAYLRTPYDPKSERVRA
ncbi:MAG: aminomethyltransferase family protein, partial [Octadecabacter sp.]|nr:aminomethyltransferase family protein [Octadecabacter sp.]